MKKLYTIIIIFAGLLLLPMPVFSEGYGRLGDITSVTGDVLAFHDGIWVKVVNTPFPLGAGRRILTRDGTAELVFDGGAILKLSNFTLVGLGSDKGTESKMGNIENRHVLVMTGEVLLSSTDRNAGNIKYTLRTPTSTARMEGDHLLAFVRLDGESFFSYADGVHVTGRYGKHPSGQFGVLTESNRLARLTAMEPFEALGERREMTDMPVRDAMQIAYDVLAAPWPAPETVSSLTAELAEKQLELLKEENDKAVVYLEGLLRRTRNYSIPPDGHTLRRRPVTIEEDRGVIREFGHAGYLDRLVQPRGSVGMRVHAGLEVSALQDDNIFNLPPSVVNTIDDYVTTVSPSILVGIYGDSAAFELGYAAHDHMYNGFPGEDYTTGIGQVGLRVGGPSGAYLLLNGELVNTEDRRLEDRSIKAEHGVSLAGAELGYSPNETGRFGMSLAYERFDIGYEDKSLDYLNRTEDRGVITLGYRKPTETSIFLELAYSQRDYYDSLVPDDDADSVDMGGGLGIKWDDEAKLSGFVKAGYAKREYTNNLGTVSDKYLDQKYAYASAAMTYKAGRTSRVKLDGYRDIEETAYAGTAGLSNSTHFIRGGGDLLIQGRFGRWFGIDLGGGAERHDYTANQNGMEARQDDIVRGRAELKVFFSRWFMFAVGYEYYEIDSNDDTRDEKHNIYTTRLGADF